METLKLLNIGCGKRYHKDWVNIDIVKTGPDVMTVDVRNDLPFDDNSFSALYNSHVLEHLSPENADKFIKECRRILSPGGVLRIVVPDLEQITKEYLDALEAAEIKPTEQNEKNYEWMMLELYDQVVRTKSGGLMAEYLHGNFSNESFVHRRVGEEARSIKNHFTGNGKVRMAKMFTRNILSLSAWRRLLLKFILRKEFKNYEECVFRGSGEIHRWMYDRHSLRKILEKAGFKHFHIVSAFKSSIPKWETYALDGKGGVTFKPDSLFAEVQK